MEYRNYCRCTGLDSDPDGENYQGQVWPGWCHFPDFTNPNTRQWWKEQFKEYVDLGIEGFWNDMNEIATWGQMLPENMELDFEGNKASMRRGRNVYGFQMARSTYEGTKALLNGKRPFNLTRSAYSGIQRYSAVWTGDNVAYDEHMMLGVRLVNSMGLTGIAFAGYDVGGFVGDIAEAQDFPVNAANNWFGTTDTAKIQEKLFDKNDDPDVAEIQILPVLTRPVQWEPKS